MTRVPVRVNVACMRCSLYSCGYLVCGGSTDNEYLIHKIPSIATFMPNMIMSTEDSSTSTSSSAPAPDEFSLIQCHTHPQHDTDIYRIPDDCDYFCKRLEADSKRLFLEDDLNVEISWRENSPTQFVALLTLQFLISTQVSSVRASC